MRRCDVKSLLRSVQARFRARLGRLGWLRQPYLALAHVALEGSKFRPPAPIPLALCEGHRISANRTRRMLTLWKLQAKQLHTRPATFRNKREPRPETAFSRPGFSTLPPLKALVTYRGAQVAHAAATGRGEYPSSAKATLLTTNPGTSNLPGQPRRTEKGLT